MPPIERTTYKHFVGCKSVRDDDAWGHRPLLTSQFAALFLANPHLQYLDMSRTGLSNNGIFFFLLELSLCDPLVTPSGLNNLKQVVVGPPTDSMDQASLASNSGTYIPSISDALAELYFQSPALQLVALLLSTDTQSAAAHENQRSDQALIDAWRLLNEDNMSGRTTLATTVPQPCLVLRTRYVGRSVCTGMNNDASGQNDRWKSSCSGVEMECQYSITPKWWRSVRSA